MLPGFDPWLASFIRMWLMLIFWLRPLSAYSGQAFYPKLAHFYLRRPVAFWQNSLAFIRILPQGLQWTFRGPILSYYSVLLRPLLSMFAFRHFRLILSVFHIRIRPVLVSSDLAFMLSLLLFGCNPYQPNPIVPRFLIIFCSYCLMIHSSLLFRYV